MMTILPGPLTFHDVASALPVIVSLVVIEGLLSVDNALAIAVVAAPLPPRERSLVLRLGILGAYLFRAAALLIASWIIANSWIRIVGAGYLIYLMCDHLAAEAEPKARRISAKERPGFWSIFLSIQLIDLSLSVDNVIAAVALSSKFWVVCTGVFIGILALRLLVGFAIRLLEKHPILEPAAFLLVGYVGFLLLAESVFHFEIGSVVKFVGIVAILAGALAYSRSEGLRRGLSPVVGGALWGMRGVRLAVRFLCRPFGWALRRLTGR